MQVADCTQRLSHNREELHPLRQRSALHTKVLQRRVILAKWLSFTVNSGGCLPGFPGWGREAEERGAGERPVHTRGSLFFTKRTIFTDSSSKSSSMLSGRGGRTGSKFFWATVSCTMSTACQRARERGWHYALTGLGGPWLGRGRKGLRASAPLLRASLRILHTEASSSPSQDPALPPPPSQETRLRGWAGTAA